MKSIGFFASGIGSVMAGGFLSFLGNVPLQQIVNGVTETFKTSFGSLPIVMEALGLVFIAYGLINEFVLKMLNRQSDAEHTPIATDKIPKV